jgi:uncharacterized membrane protein
VTLFPFCATAITRASGAMLPFFIYMGIIILCILSQHILYHYILIKRPSLRVEGSFEKELLDLHNRKISLISILLIFILIAITYFLITDPVKQSLAILWMVLFPVVYMLMKRKIK